MLFFFVSIFTQSHIHLDLIWLRLSFDVILVKSWSWTSPHSYWRLWYPCPALLMGVLLQRCCMVSRLVIRFTVIRTYQLFFCFDTLSVRLMCSSQLCVVANLVICKIIVMVLFSLIYSNPLPETHALKLWLLSSWKLWKTLEGAMFEWINYWDVWFVGLYFL